MDKITTYYECHITLESDDPQFAKKVIEGHGWKFSRIDGDILMGDGIKCYATRHFKTSLGEKEVMLRLLNMATFLVYAKFNVTRRKIEHVIYDDRSYRICPDSCIGCILPGEQ